MLWRAGHNPGHFSSGECQDSMCLLSATSTQGSTQPCQLCKVLTLSKPCIKSMGSHWVWDIFCGGTKIPLDLGALVLAAQVGCGRMSVAWDRSTRATCESIWKCCVRWNPTENWASRIWMNIMSCLTGNFCSLLCYFCSGNCHCENHQVCYHDICNNYIPLSAVKWGRNVDWNPQFSWGLGQWQLIFNFQSLGRENRINTSGPLCLSLNWDTGKKKKDPAQTEQRTIRPNLTI